jgi:hypothetical protein
MNELELNKGDQVQTLGTPFWINGQEVVLATEVMAGGKTVPGIVQQAQPARRVQGQLSSINELPVPGLKENVAIGTFKTDQGQTFVAILGPEDNLKSVNLQQGGRA